ncbi:TaqI-like C-terminal specificity domain-containing protein [Acidobacteriota bacterium]
MPVFEAGTDPAIILVEKRKPANEEFTAAVIKTEEEIMRLVEVIGNRGFKLEVSSLAADGWTLAQSNILNLMKKLLNSGTPLGKYIHGRFYRGVLTGFNEAFVIDEATKNRLIVEDPASAELIKPWVRGRDIRKWRAEWAGFYVIFTRRGVDIEKYPAIKRHLEKFREDLEPKKSESDQKGRKPGSYKWYEIQDNIAYYEEFERPKIIYADIAKLMRASYDNSGVFCANTLYIIPTDDFSLIGILHSCLFDWYSRQNFQALGDPWKGGRLRFIAQYMEKVPIPLLTDEQKAPIIKIVKQILADPMGQDVGRLEAEIDLLVYRLYGLTEEEIAIVERKIGGK